MKKNLGIILLIINLIFVSKTFANVNEIEYINQGKNFLKQAQSGIYPEFTDIYLKKAQYFYYVASKNTPPSTEALVGLGRVYMLQNKREDAKDVLFKACSLDPYNAEVNFYFAEYFYKYDDFQTALKYYEKAKELGYKDSDKNEQMIKKCQLKLGDTEETKEIEKTEEKEKQEKQEDSTIIEREKE